MSTEATLNKIARESKQSDVNQLSGGVDFSTLFSQTQSLPSSDLSVTAGEKSSDLHGQSVDQSNGCDCISAPLEPDPVEYVAGTVASGKSRLAKTARSQAAKRSSSMCTLRNIPKTIVLAAQRDFPGESQTDAVIAYIVTHSHGLYDKVECDLSSRQKELVRSWKGDLLSGIDEQIRSLSSKVDVVRKLLRVVEVLSAYVTYDRLGFRNDEPDSISDMQLNEDNFMDFLIRAEGQSYAIQSEKDTIVSR